MKDKKELMVEFEELKKSIIIFKDDINKIIEILNTVKDNLENYYKLEEYIFNNYDKSERNYEILYNINELINFNNTIKKDINNEKDIESKFKNIYNIFNQMKKNEIRIVLDIKKEDINKNIYFLDNTNGEVPIFINSKNEEHHHDFLRELNESNVELYINNKQYKYKKYFKTEKEGIYEILLKFNVIMKDCSYMFYECSNIAKIDLTAFNTKNINNMSGFFAGCNNLTDINLSNFNTKYVNDMGGMFHLCSNLTNIDLNSFITENVTNLCFMFCACSKLNNIDLSSFNTKNVTNINGMFGYCTNLEKLDLSSFNTKNITLCFKIFGNCENLKEIKLNKNCSSKIINEIDQKQTKIIFI